MRVYVGVKEGDKVEVGVGEIKVVNEGETVENVVEGWAIAEAVKVRVVMIILLLLVVGEEGRTGVRVVKEEGRERRVVEGEMKMNSLFGLLMIAGDGTTRGWEGWEGLEGWEGRALNCDESIDAKAVKGVEVSRVVLITMARAGLARSTARLTFIPGISVCHRLL